MKIKGAIFDMDGTLVDSLMFWDVLWADIGEKYLSDKTFKPSAEADLRVRTMIYTDAMKYIREVCSIPSDEEKFVSYTTLRLENFYRYDVKAKKGAIQLLDHLRDNGIKMFVASATKLDYIHIALKSCGLHKYFSGAMSCADLGVGKDQPDIYIKAGEALGFDPSDICVFEDSYVAIETARAIGYKTVGLFDRYNFDQERLKRSSDIYMGDPTDLSALIPMIEKI